MATKLDGSMLELNVEEQLFFGVVTGSVANYEEQLSELQEVDIRGMGQRTLLHVAVKLGKLDWAERLLGMGADPGLRDSDDSSVVEVARDMSVKYPEDVSRQFVLKLVQLVKERDEKRGYVRTRDEASIRGITVEEKPNGVDVSEGETADDKNMVVMEHDLKKMGCKINLQMQQLSLKEAMDEVMSGMISRDVLLEKLEVSVTTLAEKLHPVKERVDELNAKVEGLVKSNSEILQCVRPIAEERSRNSCIKAVMSKTEILNKDNMSVSQIHGFYEKLYTTSTLTSCLLSYLQYQSQVKIMIDCGSYFIGGMKEMYKDDNGDEVNGSKYGTFADLNELKVYLGGKVDDNNGEDRVIGRFALSLAKMGMYLAFKNVGRPYAEGDELNCRRYKGIVKEAEGEVMRSRETPFDLYINWTLKEKTQLSKEIHLIAAVPGMIARYGSMEGTSKLHQQLPSLLHYYEHHVMETLLKQLRA